jgi:pyruvate dehydrogenase E2 component (dihydrolipoamide acetyltransferase)
MSIFKLPDLGEGLPDAEIRQWHVAVGDEVAADQLLVSMETAKAVVEVPSPQSGTIIKLYGTPGETIQTGAPLIEFLSSHLSKQDAPQEASTVAGKLEISHEIIDEPAMGIGSHRTLEKPKAASIKATPAVRQLAKQLGVDLAKITPKHPNGMITAVEVEHAAQPVAPSSTPALHAPLPDATQAPIPLKGATRAMAIAMTQSHQTIVPATLFDDADIVCWPEGTDITVRLITAMISACSAQPRLNGWYQTEPMAFIPAGSVHLGLAVNTEEGLFVPVIHQIETISSTALRDQINTLKAQIKNRTLPAEQLKGHSIMLSNIGTVAGRYATPIIVPPAVAILAVGKIYTQVVLDPKTHRMENHRFLPLSLTFDHRCVTGAQAATFLGAFIKSLEE